MGLEMRKGMGLGWGFSWVGMGLGWGWGWVGMKMGCG